MALRLTPLRAGFVAEIGGVDPAAGPQPAEAGQLREAAARYAILILRGQEIDYDAFVRFAGLFGSASRCADITNLNDDGTIRVPGSLEARQARGNALWHTDMPVLQAPPLAAMLLAREIPPTGGETQFADLAAAWRALSPDMRRRLKRLRAVHSLDAIRRRMGLTDPAEIKSGYAPSDHPVACFDPLSGRPSLLFGAHTDYFKGLTPEESGALLSELLAHATREEFVYTHKWRRFDLLMWNNRRVLHRVLPYDDAMDRRRLWRVEVVGGDRPSRWPRSVRQLVAAFDAARAQE